MKIALPHKWSPRVYQRRLWEYLANGGRHAAVAWPRRHGKDDVALHSTACSAMERQANYWHILPEYSQARKAIWDAVNPHSGMRRIDEAFPKEIRSYTREQEMQIGLANGSTWQLVGSDNYHSLVGTAAAGMVWSEYARSNPTAYGYLSPILMENNGWSIFISTPQGRNHFHTEIEIAKADPTAFAEILTNDDTGVFSKEALEKELMRFQKRYGDDYGRALWLQEYFSSFDASIPGSYWGELIGRAEHEGRITDVQPQIGVPVFTAWDLGWTDETAVWWFQVLYGEIRVFDYYENSNKDIEHYAKVLRERANLHEIRYETHYLPHDARNRTLAAGGKSIRQQLNDLKVGRCVIAPRLDHEEGIQAARATFPRSWFDKTRCETGLNALRAYHREWDEERQTFKAKPVHDWASHAASAWRTLSLVWKQQKIQVPETPIEERMLRASVQNKTWGEIRKAHFDKRRRERADTVH